MTPEEIRAEAAKRRQVSQKKTSSDAESIRQDAQKRRDRAQRDAIYVADNGGVVTRGADGSLAYQDDVWSTSNPDAIKRIMDGEAPSDVSMSMWDQETISRAPVTARVQEFVRGFPAVGSFMDELAGVVKGEGAKQNSRALTSAMQRENPWETTALNVGGTAVSAVPAGMALGPRLAQVAPTSRAGQVALGVPTGIAAGATEGALYQYGEDRNAGRGAAIGAATGGAIGLAAPYVNSLVKSLVEWGKGTDVSAIAKTLNVSADTATVIRNAFRADDLNAAREALAAAGSDGMLADAGQAARELLDAAAASGGQAGAIARDAVEARASAASDNLNTALDDVFGKPLGQQTAVRGIRDATRDAKNTAYTEAYAQPIDYASDGGRYLETSINRVPNRVLNKANELMSIDGTQSQQMLFKIGDDGRVTWERLPSVEQLHYVLQGLDDAIEGAKGAFGRATTESRKLSNLRRQIANTLKKEVPAFKVAQDIAADSAKMEAAVDLGYDLLKTGTRRETVMEALDGVGKSEREAFKQGVRSYIDDTLANVRRTITDDNVDAREAMKLLSELSSRSNRTKIATILGGKEANRLFEALDKEAITLGLRAAIATNSKTAIRQSIQQGVKDQVSPDALQTLMQAEPLQASKRVVQALSGETAEAQTLREMGIFEEIAAALTSVRGKGAERALRTIQKAIEGAPISEKEATQIANVLVASGAVVLNRRAQEKIQPSLRGIQER